MTCKSTFIYTDKFLDYHFHSDHPFNQQRVLLTKELLEAVNLLPKHLITAPRTATDEELALFHAPAYINAVKKAGTGHLSEEEGLEHGLGTEDTPMFRHMHEASSHLVGGTLTAVDSVLLGNTNHALNLGGGLHHGFSRKASGFCIYNDGAIAIKYIREKYNLKVLYVDTDAHHGDGVQWAFYDDPNVCTLSIHETGRYLFPGTGNISERGIKEGHGYAFNVPIDAFTEDESFIQVYESVFRKVAAFFRPDVILTQNGADAHVFDPLTHLCTTTETFERIPLIAHELAHQYCDGRWIALGGGGYDMWRVVPRTWAQIWSVMTTGETQKAALPKPWLSKWQKKSPVELPDSWNDSKDIVPNIPRKPEITEKNERSLLSALKYTKNKSAYM
ncbi:acetoin utilization protein AcuC [Lentibacillus cibarius]|uniref:Acetoin utilization protein AcuC n=1 Tax=Lentibacillus cibarius TaxID=2583219 RepID=A0A5S3QH17_9BACI|nr:acetoin utilization protein AcuC [Lentibacillus cibarius]TMN21192.1 acetoin utilization protein AcuC [Lentibacillus cibarius]